MPSESSIYKLCVTFWFLHSFTKFIKVATHSNKISILKDLFCTLLLNITVAGNGLYNKVLESVHRNIYNIVSFRNFTKHYKAKTALKKYCLLTFGCFEGEQENNVVFHEFGFTPFVSLNHYACK